MGAGEPEQVGGAQRFALAAVRETLGKSTDVDSCSRLASRIDDLMTQALDYFRKAGADIACRAGCSFCCHLRVMVRPHEAIALFRYLGSRMPEEQAATVRRRLIENAARITAGNATNVPCAFLVDGKCSAYEARPAACSGYHSLSRERCEKEYEQRGASAEGIPVLEALKHVATALDEGTEEALLTAGLSGTHTELHTAVAALLRNPALIQGWRSGRALIKQLR